MLDNFSGATRVHLIVGDPIAQVKSPFGVTQAFEAKGQDAICVPAHVSAQDLTGWLAGVSLARNVDGIIVTVPHKFDSYALCKTASPRAEFLNAVNTLRRNPDGSWHGDMFDGLGFVTAMHNKGYNVKGKKALLVGAGGAGCAIAHSLVLAGVRELAIHDESPARRETLMQRLNSLQLCPVVQGSPDPSGCDIAINATPVGMKATDPSPILIDAITPEMLVGCVITVPEVPPLILAARDKGCLTVIGTEMFAQVRELMVQFLTEV